MKVRYFYIIILSCEKLSEENNFYVKFITRPIIMVSITTICMVELYVPCDNCSDRQTNYDSSGISNTDLKYTIYEYSFIKNVE